MYGQLISSVTVGAGGASNIEFTGIAGSFTDLVAVVNLRSTYSSLDTINVTVNGSTTGYSWRVLFGNGASASSWTGSGSGFQEIGAPGTNHTANTFSNGILTFPNYSGSTNKSFSVDYVTENNGTTAYAWLIAGLWSSTSAITSIKFASMNANLAQYSTISLYGLTKGSGGATVS